MSTCCYKEISRHGLTEVYHPSSDVKAVANIIFVHGLFGNPEKTWTGHLPSSKSHLSRVQSENIEARSSLGSFNGSNAEQKEQPSEAVFWPSELLPNIVPNTRIFTWGYDADIDGFWSSSSQNTVSQHATNLLSDVTDLFEDNACNLPVIFVVHSLGGIVVKDAINQSAASRNARTNIVAPTVHGIIFLGTPHRGSKSASVGKVAYQITMAATRRPNLKLLQALEQKSGTLDEVASSFLHTLEEYKQIQVYSFREEKETRKFWIFSSIVVDSDSAKIGWAKEQLNSIPSNHRGMSKFSSTTDIGFKRVSAQIRRWVHSIPVNSKAPVKEDFTDCISSLDSAATKARLKTVAPSHAETLQWVFDSSAVSFSTWLGDDKNTHGAIYWIQGKPGSGKSTLMKFAMGDPRARDMLEKSEGIPYVIAGFFFHDRGTLIQKSISGMLQELLHSTLVQASNLGEFVQPIYASIAAAQRTKTPTWDFEALQKAFEAIVTQRQVLTRICLFLDALDEHHGDNEQLAVLLHSLASQVDGRYVKIKLCIASRPWDTFTVNFSSCPGFKIHEHTSNDIRTYTLSKLNKASPKGTETSSTGNSRVARLEALASQVTEKAHGVFIWVRIVVDEITKGVRDRVPFLVLEEKLSKMPEELKDLYEHTLERIELEHTEEAYVMLQIALCALSPLNLEAFVNATSFTLWKIAPPAGEETLEDMRQRVISRSGGLLEVSGKITSFDDTDEFTQLPTNQSFALDYFSSVQQFVVQFLHQTVKEFIQARDDNLGLRRFRSGGCGSQYLLDVGISCWDNWADDTALKMFEYARRLRPTGLRSDKYLEETLSKFISLRRGDYFRIDWWLNCTTGFHSRDYIRRVMEYADADINLLCLALAAGLFKLVRKFYATMLLNFDKRTTANYALMSMAMIGPKTASKRVPRREMLSLLFDIGIDVDSLPPAIILHGSHDHVSYMRTPLARLIYFKGQFDQDESERVSAIECLLEAGADPNADFGPGSSETIFSECIKQESAEVVRIFGKHGAIAPAFWIPSKLVIWRNLKRQSDVLKEVIEILERNYPGVGRLPQDAPGPEDRFSTPEASVSALVASEALTALGHGASWVFRRCLTAKERWRFAINRTMWLRDHRVTSVLRRPTTFEDVVLMAMAVHVGLELYKGYTGGRNISVGEFKARRSSQADRVR